VIPKQFILISLAAQGTRPDLAYKRVTALAKIYQQRLNELRHNDADARELFAQADLNKARINLKQTQTALAKFNNPLD